MFKRISTSLQDVVTVLVEGQAVQVVHGASAAAAALAAGLKHTRESAISQASRGPWCMMGVCFECLMEIDGEPNRQACLIPVREGMTINRQLGAPDLKRRDINEPGTADEHHN
jgi:predicted molibdopterin-dependent oxidoreductase YjgC